MAPQVDSIPSAFLPSGALSQPGGLVDLERELILSNHGFLPWFASYGRIRDEKRQIVVPEPNILQERFAETMAYCLDRGIPLRFLLLKPRQRGCSTVSVAGAYWLSRRYHELTGGDGRPYCPIENCTPINGTIIGGEYEQSDNLWKILNLYHARDRFDWPGGGGEINDQCARWDNDSYFDKETARDAEAGRSDTLQAVIATECARWKEDGAAPASEVITGILNCIPDEPYTLAILESTAKGDFGMFYDYWQDAITIEDHAAGRIPKDWNGYFRIFAGWHEFPSSCDRLSPARARLVQSSYTDDERDMVARHHLSPGQVAWYRRIMRAKCKRDPIIMRREQPATPEEAFHAASNRRFNSFGLRLLSEEAHAASTATETQLGILQPTDSGAFLLQPVPKAESALFHFYEAPRVGHRYVMAVDIASGAAQTETADPDHHCAIVLRAGYFDTHRAGSIPDSNWHKPRVVAATVKPCQWPVDILAEHVAALSRYYGGCTIIPEDNNDRGLIYMLLQLEANVYQRSADDDQPVGTRSPHYYGKKKRTTGKYGFTTTGGKGEGTRSYIIEWLDRAVREWDVEGEGIEIYDLATLHEMKRFVIDKKTGRAEAAAGEHDDRVIALAIANANLKAATTYTAEERRGAIPRDILLEEMESSGGYGSGELS